MRVLVRRDPAKRLNLELPKIVIKALSQQKEPKGRIGKTRRQKVGVVVLVSLRR